MSVINVTINPEELTLTLVAQFAAPIERIWQIWADPRQLERWWGPPTWPATFVRHDLVVGGESRYYMTGPDGEKSRGWWRITAVDAPNAFSFEDGFAGDDGEPSGFLGTTKAVVTLEATGDGTRMTSVSSFESATQLDEMIKMGMAEGMRLAAGQIDSVLAGVDA